MDQNEPEYHRELSRILYGRANLYERAVEDAQSDFIKNELRLRAQSMRAKADYHANVGADPSHIKSYPGAPDPIQFYVCNQEGFTLSPKDDTNVIHNVGPFNSRLDAERYMEKLQAHSYFGHFYVSTLLTPKFMDNIIKAGKDVPEAQVETC